MTSRKRPLELRAPPLEVTVPAPSCSTPGSGPEPAPHPPALRRLTTPDCMSSPVSHLRDLTRDLEEDGAKRRRAAQYLRESRLAHLQQRRLVLVLDLDETLVHSLRGSVRQIGAAACAPAAEAEAADGGEEDDDDEGDDEGADENGAANRLAPRTMAAAPARARTLPAASAAAAPSSIGPLPAGGGSSSSAANSGAAAADVDNGAAGDGDNGDDDGEEGDESEVTLQVQNVEFEMKLRPGVHAFLREMSALFCVHLYTMGSREYVQQALHHLDPNHEIFKPGQVLAWNPALDRTTKTLQRLLCVPELVLIVDDSPIAWANHLPNLVLIDRFVGAPTDNSLQRVGAHLKAIHRSYFDRCTPALHLPTSAHPPLAPLTLPPQAMQVAGAAAAATRRLPPLPTVPESPVVAAAKAERRSTSSSRRHSPSVRMSPRHTSSPLISNSADSDAVGGAAAPVDGSDCADGSEAADGGGTRGALPTVASEVSLSGGSSSVPSPTAELDQTTVVVGRAMPPAIADAPAQAEPPPPPAPSAATSSVLPGRGGADVRDLLLDQCATILAGVHCTFLGPSDLLLVDGIVPPEVTLARRFGACISTEITTSCTHLLVPPALLAEGTLLCERTDGLVQQIYSANLESDVHVVDARCETSHHPARFLGRYESCPARTARVSSPWTIIPSVCVCLLLTPTSLCVLVRAYVQVAAGLRLTLAAPRRG